MTGDKNKSQQQFRTSTMDADQTSYAGFVDGDVMCERFASGYQPKDATGFVRNLVARLTGLR